MIHVRETWKSYGLGRNGHEALKGINLPFRILKRMLQFTVQADSRDISDRIREVNYIKAPEQVVIL